VNRPIGYYVHHHGDGHRQRAMAIGSMLENVTLIGTGVAGRVGPLSFLDLPDDRLGEDFTGIDHAERPSVLHYAPLDHEAIRQRTALMSGWIAQARPRLMVVDVSVEVAMLARLASVPTVYVRLSGRRVDHPHLDAFRGAVALLAPFFEALDDDDVPAWVRKKTYYAPGIVRLHSEERAVDKGVVLVVLGRGGDIANGDRWAAAARSMPERQWRILGPCTAPSDAPDNLDLRGWVNNVGKHIGEADVVIGGAGDGVVSAVLAARRPFICLPEPRPFAEQLSKARRLEATGGAVVRYDWPATKDWPGLIIMAIQKAERWPACLTGREGAERVASWLDSLPSAMLTKRRISGGPRD
jgi:hypothetical protein